MSTSEITIRVKPELADAYRSASEEDRRKLDVLLGLSLADYLEGPSLQEAMHAMSEEAKRNGLTPEILESILRAGLAAFPFSIRAAEAAAIYPASRPAMTPCGRPSIVCF